jgi:hypothetical protein
MILFYGEDVAIIPDAEIESIRRTIEVSGGVEPHPYLKCGERVRVIRGSMEGVEGILVRKKNQCRLVLSVSMLAHSVSVEIDAMDVEPVGPTDSVNSVQSDQALDFGMIPEIPQVNPRQQARMQ